MTITVRRARVDDAAAMARLMGDPAVYPGLMQMPYASEELQRARLVESLAPGKPDILLVAERGGEVVGSCGMHPAGPSPRRRHVMTLGISVRADAQGQGVGSALMQAMCDIADRWLGCFASSSASTSTTSARSRSIAASASRPKAGRAATCCATASTSTPS